MPRFVPASRLVALLAMALSLVWVGWSQGRRAERLEAVSALPTWSVASPVRADDSVTGYAGERRRQIVAGNNRESMRWIRLTQAWLAGDATAWQHDPLVNAPEGIAVSEPALYRWWLGGVAWLSGGGGAGVEAAARRADPWLQGLLVLLTAGLMGRVAGGAAAAVAAVGMATVFPLAADFAPGAPHAAAAGHVLAVVSMACLLSGSIGRGGVNGWWAVAGALAGAGVTLAPDTQPLLVVGTVAAGALGRWAGLELTALPWRVWGWGGAVVVVANYLNVNGLTSVGGEARWNQLLVAASWAAAAEGLARVGQKGGRWMARGSWTFAAAWPVAAAMGWVDAGLAGTPADSLFTVTGIGLGEGWVETGITFLLPWVAGMGMGLAWWWRRDDAAVRWRLLVVGGPALVAVGMASFRERWWVVADGQLVLGLAVAVAALASQWRRWPVAVAGGMAGLAVVIGGVHATWPARIGPVANDLSAVEVAAVLERDLAHWLNVHTGPEERTVLASPHLTPALAYYGSIRGLGTLESGNEAGDMAAIRMLSATSPAETVALMEARGVTHVVWVSWDPLLENYVRIGRRLPGDAPLPDDTFLHAVKRWALPPWLQPLPYPLPTTGGWAAEQVVVLRRVDDTGVGNGLARLAEYFLEEGETAAAAGLRERLRGLSAEPGVWPALGRIEAAVGDEAGLRRTLDALQRVVAQGDYDFEPWDRRLSLAVLLTQVKLLGPARAQLVACMEEADTADLRGLPAAELLRLVALARLHEVPWPSEALRSEALGMLPPEYRARLGE